MEQKVKCPVCDQRFISLNNLQTHAYMKITEEEHKKLYEELTQENRKEVLEEFSKDFFPEKEKDTINKEIEIALRGGIPPQDATSKIMVNREVEKEKLNSLLKGGENYLFIVGDNGSGKSFLLNWFTEKCLTEEKCVIMKAEMSEKDISFKKPVSEPV